MSFMNYENTFLLLLSADIINPSPNFFTKQPKPSNKWCYKWIQSTEVSFLLYISHHSFMSTTHVVWPQVTSLPHLLSPPCLDKSALQNHLGSCDMGLCPWCPTRGKHTATGILFSRVPFWSTNKYFSGISTWFDRTTISLPWYHILHI